MKFSEIKIFGYYLEDILSPERWKMVRISMLMKRIVKLERRLARLEGVNSDTDLYDEPHIIEQYMWRFLNCANCLELGKCVKCKCPALDKMKVRSDYCKDGKWGPFMKEGPWNEFKKAQGIKFCYTRGSVTL